MKGCTGTGLGGSKGDRPDTVALSDSRPARRPQLRAGGIDETLKPRWGIIGLDARALGLFRVITGLNLIYNLIKYRLLYVEGFYADPRVLPDGVLARLYGENFSLLRPLDSPWAVTAFLLFALVAAVLFTIGWRPKLTGLVSLLLFWSIIHDNPMVSHGVENFIEVCLFWGLLLPLNGAFTLFPTAGQRAAGEVRSIPTWAFLFQIAVIYLTSTVTKNGPLWASGRAIEAIMADRTYAGLIAAWLGSYPELCRFLTYSAQIIEALVALLLFFPLANRVCRTLAAILLLGLHWGLAVSMEVGQFYLMTTGFAVLFLPGFVWDRLLGPAASTAVEASEGSSLSARLRIPLLRGIFAILLALFVLQKNMEKWGEQSYLSSAIASNGVTRAIAGMDTPDIGLGGVFRQPWWLFAPDPPREMGTILFVGIDAQGNIHDLLAGELMFERDVSSGESRQVGEPRNRFTGSRFVLSWYVRRYRGLLPPSVFVNWSRYEYERWNPPEGGPVINEVGLILFSDYVSLTDGELSRATHVEFLGKYVPPRDAELPG